MIVAAVLCLYPVLTDISSGIKLRFYSSSSFSDLDQVVYWPYGNAISTLVPNSKPEHYRYFSNDEPVFGEDFQGLAYHNNWKDFVETTSTYKVSGKVWELAEILEKKSTWLQLEFRFCTWIAD